MKNGVPGKILLVDDDLDDLEFYGESLRSANSSIMIEEEHSGVKALEYLRKAKKKNALHCLIILDINMPMMNGKETFNEIQKDRELAAIPLVIFSTAASTPEEEYFKSQGIKYFKKPHSCKEMEKIAIQLLSHCS